MSLTIKRVSPRSLNSKTVEQLKSWIRSHGLTMPKSPTKKTLVATIVNSQKSASRRLTTTRVSRTASVPRTVSVPRTARVSRSRKSLVSPMSLSSESVVLATPLSISPVVESYTPQGTKTYTRAQLSRKSPSKLRTILERRSLTSPSTTKASMIKTILDSNPVVVSTADEVEVVAVTPQGVVSQTFVGSVPVESVSFATMTVKDLKKALTAHGITPSPKAKKADLISMLESHGADMVVVDTTPDIVTSLPEVILPVSISPAQSPIRFTAPLSESEIDRLEEYKRNNMVGIDALKTLFRANNPSWEPALIAYFTSIGLPYSNESKRNLARILKDLVLLF